MRLLTLILLVLTGYFVNVACIGHKTFEKSQVELKRAQQKTKELTERNEMVEVNIRDLKNSQSFESVENIARSSLGMIKPNEKFYRVTANDEYNKTNKN